MREHMADLHDLRGEATREQLRVELLERDLTRARAARLERLAAEATLRQRWQESRGQGGDGEPA